MSGHSNLGTWIMPSITVTTATATSTTSAFTIPNDVIDACFVYKGSSTFSGTTLKLDLSLETSPDGGTTYFTVGRFLQISAASVTNRLVLSFNAGAGNTASTTTNAGGGNNSVITATQTNLSLCSGCPIVYGPYNRFRYILTATTPSVTFSIYGWGNRMGRRLVTP